MNQQARKAIGCGGLLLYIGLYAVGAATLGALLAPALPAWAELIYYAVAGVIWIFPLKPLFGWMNRRDPS
jgi:membrane protein implicated in regulation of membrane protease activity